MKFKMAILTPVAHIKGLKERMDNMCETVHLPYADFNIAKENSKDCEVIFVNPNKMRYKLTDNFLEGSKIKFIVTASTGTNHIETDKAKIISLTTAYEIINRISSTAEHAFALTLALIRNIPQAYSSVMYGGWSYEKYIGRQLSELTAGVIGYGRLGKMYAKYAEAFGMKVICHDPKYENNLKEIQENADVISLHVHLNDDTKNMIDRSFLEGCMKRPYIINTSRGDIVDESAIIELVPSRIAGYAADVIKDELEGNILDSPLVMEMQDDNNIIITPHIGGMTIEAQEIAYHGVLDLFEEAWKNEVQNNS